MHSNSGTPRRYSESDKRRSVSMKRPMPLKPGLKAVSSTPLTAAALAKVPTVSAMSATSAFCFSARPDLMDPIPTVEAEKTANRIPVGTKKKDLFNKGEPKQKVECPNVQPVSKSIKEPTRKGINELANQLDDARNDAEQLENNSKTGSKLAAGRCMSMITEEFFLQEFENVNSDHILPDFELREAVGTIIEVLNNTSTVWTRQVANLKQLRSLMKTRDKPRCSDILPSLLGPLQTSVRSLRSQVVREACITVGYLSTLFGVEFGYTAEHLLPSLIASLHKSVKVISQSSHICIRIVIKNTQFADMIPVVASNFSSKSKFIRRGSMEILCQMLCMWPQDMLDKQTAVLRSTINLGINDADSDTRIEARRTFNVFESRFPTCADALFKSLNAVKQKVIHPSVSPTAYSKLVASASVSIASCASSSVDIAETVTLANPTVLSTTHSMSPPDFCDNTHVEIMSTSPPQNKQGGHSDPAMPPDVAPVTPERNGDVNDDELLRTLDILQKSVLGSAHGDISQLPVQTTVKHSGTATVLSASRSVNKRRDDVKKDVLSKLAEIEHMVLCDATKPGGAIPSYKEPVPKNESPQPSPDLATTRDNKVAGRCSFDSECGMIELTTSTSEGATTGEETPLVTPITIFKSKLKAKELPSTSTNRITKGISNLVKHTQLCESDSLRQPNPLNAVEPPTTLISGGSNINPASKKTSNKGKSSKLIPPRVIKNGRPSPAPFKTSMVDSQGPAKPVVQEDAKPILRIACRKLPLKMVRSGNLFVDKNACSVKQENEKNARQPENVPVTSMEQESSDSADGEPVLHMRRRWSHSVPCQLKNLALTRKRFNSTTSASRKPDEFGMTMENFTDAYEKVPQIHVTSFTDLTKRLLAIHRVLVSVGSTSGVLVESMKQVRALTISSDANSEGFMRNIRKLVPALRTCLRNNSTCTVVKETCITIAFLSVRVGSKFDVFAATLLPLLLELLPSVSRLTATAAGLCITIIMQNIHSAKLVPVIIAHCSSNVKIIRRECIMYLRNIIRDWPPSVLERCITNSIPAALKLCLNATDLRTRNIAKDVFCEFAKHFPTNATNLLDELDIKKKLLLTKTLQMKKQQDDQPQDDGIQVEVKCAEMPHHQSNAKEAAQPMERSRFDKFLENKIISSGNVLGYSKATSPVASSPLKHKAPKVLKTTKSLSSGSAIAYGAEDDKEHRAVPRRLSPRNGKSEVRIHRKSVSPANRAGDEMEHRAVPRSLSPKLRNGKSRVRMPRKSVSSAFEMRSGSTSCMIPTRVQDSSEGECERSSMGSAAYPARMSSDQKTRSSGSSDVSADKKRKSCLSQLTKQNSTSPVPQKHRSSMIPKNLIQTSRTSDKRKDRSLSKKRTTEKPHSDTQNQGVRAPVRPQQGMHDFRSGSPADWKSKASMISSSDDVSTCPAMIKRYKRCPASAKSEGENAEICALKPSPCMLSPSVNSELFRNSARYQRAMGIKDSIGTNDIEPENLQPNWSGGGEVTPTSVSPRLETAPAAAMSNLCKARLTSRLPRRLDRRVVSPLNRATSESTKVEPSTMSNSSIAHFHRSSPILENSQISDDLSTAKTQTTMFSNKGLSYVAHLLSPAMLSTLASLVPAQHCSSRTSLPRSASSSPESLSDSLCPESQPERSSYSPEDNRVCSSTTPNVEGLARSAFAEETCEETSVKSPLSKSLPWASGSNTDGSQGSSDISKGLPISQHSSRSDESTSQKTMETTSEEEQDDILASDGSLESGSSQDLAESANVVHDTDDLYVDIKPLAKGTFENASPSVRISRLEHEPHRRNSNARVKSLSSHSRCIRRNNTEIQRPHSHMEEGTKRTEDGKDNEPTSLMNQQWIPVSGRRKQNSPGNYKMEQNCITRPQNEQRSNGKIQHEHKYFQKEQRQQPLVTSENEGSPKCEQRERRSSGKEHSEQRTHKYKSPGTRRQTTSCDVHMDESHHRKEDRNNLLLIQPNIRSSSVPTLEPGNGCSSKPQEVAASECSKRHLSTESVECIKESLQRSSQRHKSSDIAHTCSNSRNQVHESRGATASTSEEKYSRKTNSLAFERKPFSREVGMNKPGRKEHQAEGSLISPGQHRCLHLSKSEQSDASQNSSVRSQGRKDVTPPFHGNVPSNVEASDTSLYNSRLECFGKWSGSSALCKHGSSQADTGDSFTGSRTIHSRKDDLKPSRLVRLDHSEFSHGDQIRLEESCAQHTQNVIMRQVRCREHPSGDHTSSFPEGTVMEQQNDHLSRMLFTESNVEPMVPTLQRHIRHSSQQMDRLSKHSCSLSPVREEQSMHTSDTSKRSQTEHTGKREKEEEGEPGMDEATSVHRHRQRRVSKEGPIYDRNPKSDMTIKIPGVTLLTREMDVTCDPAKTVNNPAPLVLKARPRSPIMVTMVIPVPTKLPKGVISTATLNIKNEENVAVKLLKGNAVQAESLEIDIPDHFHHHHIKTRLRESKLQRRQTSRNDASDGDDDSDVMVEERGAKIENGMSENERQAISESKRDRTRTEILNMMERCLISNNPDKRSMLSPKHQCHRVSAGNVPVFDVHDDVDSDSSGVVSDFMFCGSKDITAGHTWSNTNSMRRLRINKSHRDHTISSASIIGYKQRPVIRKTVADALRRMQSRAWCDRKRGLASLKTMLNSGSRRLLNSLELKKVVSVLMKMFQETETTVYVLFLEALCDLVHIYNAQLHGWLDKMLTSILSTVERRPQQSSTVQTIKHKTLDTMRVCFPCRLQLLALTNFILHDAEDYTTEVHLVTLSYMHSLTLTLGPQDLVEMADLGLLIAFLLTWISDQRNNEVVQVSEAILISLYSLSPGIFQRTVLKLPRTFQENLLTLIDEDIKSMYM